MDSTSNMKKKDEEDADKSASSSSPSSPSSPHLVADPHKAREIIRTENAQYLSRHPEVKGILQLYMDRLFEEQPKEGLAAWSTAFFTQPDLREKAAKHTVAVAAAAAAAAAETEKEDEGER